MKTAVLKYAELNTGAFKKQTSKGDYFCQKIFFIVNSEQKAMQSGLLKTIFMTKTIIMIETIVQQN